MTFIESENNYKNHLKTNVDCTKMITIRLFFRCFKKKSVNILL